MTWLYGYVYETDKEISEAGIANSSAELHPAETVVLSRDAGIGKSGVMAVPMAVSQHFIAWKCDNSEKLNSWFLYNTKLCLFGSCRGTRRFSFSRCCAGVLGKGVSNMRVLSAHAAYAQPRIATDACCRYDELSLMCELEDEDLRTPHS